MLLFTLSHQAGNVHSSRPDAETLPRGTQTQLIVDLLEAVGLQKPDAAVTDQDKQPGGENSINRVCSWVNATVCSGPSKLKRYLSADG
jgi:hypothetical protein